MKKVIVINGSKKQGNTSECVRLFLEALQEEQELSIEQVNLPKDMPEICVGCSNCFLKGEEKCPHHAYTMPIKEKMLQADLIIMATPVYGFDIGSPLKLFLDHYCYLWLSHRPQKEMFSKVIVGITTTAGAGIGHATKTLKNNFLYWGALRYETIGVRIGPTKLEEIKTSKIGQRLRKEAHRVSKYLSKTTKLRPYLKTRLLFYMMRMMQIKTKWNETDYKHWEQQGWLEKNMKL